MSEPKKTPEEIADAVFDRIRTHLFNDDPGHAYLPLLTCAKAREEIAEAIRQERRASGWVRVEGRLPDEDVLVVYADGKGRSCCVCWYDWEGGTWRERMNREVRGVTHWRELPPLPGEEEGNL